MSWGQKSDRGRCWEGRVRQLTRVAFPRVIKNKVKGLEKILAQRTQMGGMKWRLNTVSKR